MQSMPMLSPGATPSSFLCFSSCNVYGRELLHTLPFRSGILPSHWISSTTGPTAGRTGHLREPFISSPRITLSGTPSRHFTLSVRFALVVVLIRNQYHSAQFFTRRLPAFISPQPYIICLYPENVTCSKNNQCALSAFSPMSELLSLLPIRLL